MSLSTDVIGQLSVVLRGNEFVDNIYSFDNEMAVSDASTRVLAQLGHFRN
jgi:hypothetical protein